MPQDAAQGLQMAESRVKGFTTAAVIVAGLTDGINPCAIATLVFFMSLLGPQNVSHVGHLGGVLVGWILLRRMGTTGGLSFKSLRHRWRRYKMRRNLRSVRMDELRSRRRSDDDHRTFH